MATSKGWKELILPALLMGVLGYSIATGILLLSSFICFSFSQSIASLQGLDFLSIRYWHDNLCFSGSNVAVAVKFVAALAFIYAAYLNLEGVCYFMYIRLAGKIFSGLRSQPATYMLVS